MIDDEVSPNIAWSRFVDSLRTAGDRLAADVDGLSAEEQADGYRALVRALNNQLGRFEVDRLRPELVAFNGWREKMLMDNPDFAYWVADIADDGRYRIVGTRGNAVYLSITVYRSGGTLDAGAVARIDSDALTFDADGRFELTVAPAPDGDGPWLALPSGASSLWVRMFHDHTNDEGRGTCRIDPIDPPPPGRLDPARFAHQLDRLGRSMSALPRIFNGAAAVDTAEPNVIRRWSEMTAGAAFTEPDIAYLRGGWALGDDDALVIEGDIVECRYWSVLLYSRFLNSLDHRARRVSLTSGTARVRNGRYRIVLSSRPPADDPGDWLDTEGRTSGIVVFRFLHPAREPSLPTVTRCQLDVLDRLLVPEQQQGA